MERQHQRDGGHKIFHHDGMLRQHWSGLGDALLVEHCDTQSDYSANPVVFPMIRFRKGGVCCPPPECDKEIRDRVFLCRVQALLCHQRRLLHLFCSRSPGEILERVMGIEPTWPAWKAGALPLSYTRTPKRVMVLHPLSNVR